MPKNAMILHSTGNDPNGNWYLWLKNQLQWRGYKVWVPILPDADHPDMQRYWEKLKDYPFDEHTVIIGHSSGAVAAFGCLNKLPSYIKVKQLVSVAGFVRDEGWNCEGLFTDPFNWDKVRLQASHIDVVWSPDDAYVSEDQTKTLAELVGVEPTIIPGCGHFNLEAGARFSQVPEILELITSY